MTSPPDDSSNRQASDRRFSRHRAEMILGLRALLGPRARVEPLADADRAAAIAAEAGASHREAAPHAWGIVRRRWGEDERGAVVGLLQAVGASLGDRPAWLILPGREPQVIGLPADTVLDNPTGFAALSGNEMLLLDQDVTAGLWVIRHVTSHAAGWELEVWGEPWLSAATRAIREQGNTGTADR